MNLDVNGKGGGGYERVLISTSISFEWPEEFKSRREIVDNDAENRPLIEALAGGSAVEEEETAVRAFMQGPDEPDNCLPQADKVQLFCSQANLNSLKSNEKGDLVALLDDRSFEEGNEGPRDHRGPLTARDLYHELRKPVSLSGLDLFYKGQTLI